MYLYLKLVASVLDAHGTGPHEGLTGSYKSFSLFHAVVLLSLFKLLPPRSKRDRRTDPTCVAVCVTLAKGPWPLPRARAEAGERHARETLHSTTHLLITANLASWSRRWR